VPLVTVNRFCASGLESCGIIASKIIAGYIDCGIAAGVESMSVYDMNDAADLNKMDEKLYDK